MNNPTGYTNASQLFIRGVAMPNASWTNGCTIAASNSPGIGIATDVTLLGESENWTLLDQHGVARTPQDGQLIGTVASIIAPGIIVFDNAESTGDGSYAGDASLGWAYLEDLDLGWVVEPFP